MVNDQSQNQRSLPGLGSGGGSTLFMKPPVKSAGALVQHWLIVIVLRPKVTALRRGAYFTDCTSCADFRRFQRQAPPSLFLNRFLLLNLPVGRLWLVCIWRRSFCNCSALKPLLPFKGGEDTDDGRAEERYKKQKIDD